jgi:N-acetylmuramoyl-L-alanine amidase
MPEELRTGIHYTSNPGNWKKRAHHVLGSFDADAILIECAMLGNPDDARFIHSHGAQGQIAKGICKGLVGAPGILRKT